MKEKVILSFVLSYACAVLACGYENCPKAKNGVLNVHLVPHSHDDMGWLKTIDQYYYGANNSIQLAAVQYTLDSTIEELQKNPERRFIFAEIGFFWRWWTNQDDAMKEKVKDLVNSGQFEFINGGWCMNDEASTHYNEIIDQMTLGLRFLNDTFGSCAVPRVAWHIDPFGHSREQASLFAQMGFDGLFFGRLDYQDKLARRREKNMETVWSGSPDNLGKSSWLFTGALRNGYNPPDGFCFDILCSDEPVQDDPKLLGYNLERKIQDFVNASFEWAEAYRTNHVLMTMGSDFHYISAGAWYKNLDKLIKYVNSRHSSEINVFYSTPACYLQEVHKSNLNWTMKSDDYFPYASDPHAFWTGYFTSRPALKSFIHQSNNILQICKHWAAFSSNDSLVDEVLKLAEPMAVAQHHDAIAGTAKQHVTNDYAQRLSRGLESCNSVIIQGYKEFYNQQNETNEISGFTPPAFCYSTLNISSCQASERMSDFYVNIYNPMSRALADKVIRIPVPSPNYKALGSTGEIPIQVVPIPKPIFGIPGRTNTTSQYELIIPIDTSVPPMSISTIGITKTAPRETNSIGLESVHPWKSFSRNEINRYQEISDITIGPNNKGLSFILDGRTGLMKTVSKTNTLPGNRIEAKSEIKVSQNFYYYEGMNGNNTKFQFRASGAYIFRPNGTQAKPITEKLMSYHVFRGPHVTEVHQTFTNWISQVIRLYQNSDSIEFEWLIGPIPIEDNIGKEILSRYNTDLQSNGVFWTDANGRELLKRKRNFRPSWTYKVYEPIAGNYYPINSRMILSESESLKQSESSGGVVPGKTVIVLNDRAQGGSSLADGQMEFMIHRRLLHDDAFGVGEPLNETAFGDKGLVVRGKHWLIFAGDKTGVPVSIHRKLAREIYQSPLLTFHNGIPSFEEGADARDRESFVISPKRKASPSSTNQIKPSNASLPPNINLLTFEKLKSPTSTSEYLLRLEHFYEVGEDEVFSKEVSLSVSDLRTIFGNFQSIRETTLAANQWKDEASRLLWNVNPGIDIGESMKAPKTFTGESMDSFITWQPMEIKTFILTY